MVAGLNEDTTNQTKPVVLTQTQDGWQDTSITDIGGVKVAANDVLKAVGKGQTIVVKYSDSGVTFSK